MKITLIILAVLGALLGLLLVGSQWLPERFLIRRSVVIRSKPDRIFPLVNNLEFWESWSSLSKEQDPSIVHVYRGPETGVGARSEWQSNKMGNGRMAITESVRNEKVGYSLYLDKGKLTTNGFLVIEPVPGGSEVIWVSEGRVGKNPVMRYASYYMDQLMGPELEKGLAKLKAEVESRTEISAKK